MARAPQHLPESSAVDLAYEALEGIVGPRQMWPPWLGFSTSRISCDANKVSVDYGLTQPNVRARPAKTTSGCYGPPTHRYANQQALEGPQVASRVSGVGRAQMTVRRSIAASPVAAILWTGLRPSSLPHRCGRPGTRVF